MIFMLFQIIIIISDIVHEVILRQLENAMGRPIDEITVMADIEDGAFIIIQGILEDFLRGDVQMVRGLIENKEIGISQHKLCQRHASAFSAAQVADQLKDVLAGKEESGKNVTDFRVGEPRIFIGDFFE